MTDMNDVMQEVWNEIDKEEKGRKIPVGWIPKKATVTAEVTQPLNVASKSEDMVNHPPHYGRDYAMECIDEMIYIFGEKVVMDFCLCNVWKYRYRAADKNGQEDIKKSDWYMAKYKELNEKIEKERTDCIQYTSSVRPF